MTPLFLAVPSLGIDGVPKGTPILINPASVELAVPVERNGQPGYALHVGGRAVAWVDRCSWEHLVVVKSLCAGDRS